jgi:hypothetical protein
VDGHEIIPPTWSKSQLASIMPQWKHPEELLERANHIRVIGYSLPVSDTYIRYLLKATVINNKNLKHIDVVNIDSNGETKARFGNFVNFKYTRFATKRVEDYLAAVFSETMNHSRVPEPQISCTKLEQAHEDFMGSG